MLAVMIMLSGCAPTFAAENSEVACADWVPYDSVDEAADGAELVVRAELEPTDTTVTMHGEPASLHRATVTEVFRGDAAVGDVLDVVSTPASCTTGAPYPDGDPMLRDEATLVLRPGTPAWGSADFLQTITPYSGVWDERPTAE
ncbi:hypothetical protein ASG06_07540 [Rathayibacter sp. Leaf185]|nr:hypothetical protein ASF42_07540 [Rathayibacter sp. Leaf294]KQS11829.1 hypothetical protein ASG06_07540 [Rathayibacter sp. Leaf185]